MVCAWFGDSGTESWFQCSLGMSLRADIYRQRAAEAKQSAAQAKNPSIKSAFKEVARGWLVLPSKWSGWTIRKVPFATKNQQLKGDPRGELPPGPSDLAGEAAFAA
jgi:hypothetical protein